MIEQGVWITFRGPCVVHSWFVCVGSLFREKTRALPLQSRSRTITPRVVGTNHRPTGVVEVEVFLGHLFRSQTAGWATHQDQANEWYHYPLLSPDRTTPDRVFLQMTSPNHSTTFTSI